MLRCAFTSRLRVLLARQEMNAQDSRPMRRLLAALSSIWLLVGGLAPAVLATACDPIAPHACCASDRSVAPAAQIAGCAPCCACDELRSAPSAPATVPERLSAPGPVAV